MCVSVCARARARACVCMNIRVMSARLGIRVFRRFYKTSCPCVVEDGCKDNNRLLVWTRAVVRSAVDVRWSAGHQYSQHRPE